MAKYSGSIKSIVSLSMAITVVLFSGCEGIGGSAQSRAQELKRNQGGELNPNNPAMPGNAKQPAQDSAGQISSENSVGSKSQPAIGGASVGVGGIGGSGALKPKYGMIVNDLRCGMCHLQVNGDLMTLGDLKSFEPDPSLPVPGNADHIVSPIAAFSTAGQYDEKVNGTWFLSGRFPQDRSRTVMKLSVSGGIKESYVGPEIPSGGFPVWDVNVVATRAKGSIDATDVAGSVVRINGSAAKNIVLDGSVNPIKIAGDVLVLGDVVILGRYSGVGTIYATGNIYVAGSITASNSAFPFPSDRALAVSQGRVKAANSSFDAIGLASSSAILVGDPSAQFVTIQSNLYPSAVTAKNIHSWFPGGENGYKNLIKDKVSKGVDIRWDAFFYAKSYIAGKSGPFVLNGGFITKSFAVIPLFSGSQGTPSTLGTVNFDYRFMSGMKIMEGLDGPI